MKFDNNVKKFLSLNDTTIDKIGLLEKPLKKKDFNDLNRIISSVMFATTESCDKEDLNILRKFYNDFSAFLSIRIGSKTQEEKKILNRMSSLKSLLKKSKTFEDIIVFSKCIKEETDIINNTYEELPKFRYYNEILNRMQGEDNNENN